jgi:hypothetical protein
MNKNIIRKREIIILKVTKFIGGIYLCKEFKIDMN